MPVVACVESGMETADLRLRQALISLRGSADSFFEEESTKCCSSIVREWRANPQIHAGEVASSKGLAQAQLSGGSPDSVPVCKAGGRVHAARVPCHPAGSGLHYLDRSRVISHPDSRN